MVVTSLFASVAIPLAIADFHADAVKVGLSTNDATVTMWIRQVAWDVQVFALCVCGGLLVLTGVMGTVAWRIRRSLETRLAEVVRFTSTIPNEERKDVLQAYSDDEIGELVRAVDEVAEYVWNSQETLRRDGERQLLDAQVQRALAMTDTEEDVLGTTRRALERIAPEHKAQLLLADKNRQRLLTVLPDPDAPSPCPVSTPRGCAAVRRGQSMVFWDGTALDACPKMRERATPQHAAVCVPLSINGQSIGVVHTPMDDGKLLTSGRIDQLKHVVRHASARIGMIRALQTSQEQAETDPLTGLLNRRSLEMKLASLTAGGEGYALAICDLDHFKKLNDNHGHHVGDAALELFSKVVQDAVRPTDLVARLGGEEFLVVFPGGSVEHVLNALERVRQRLRDELVSSSVPSFTCSFGVAESPTHGREPAGVIERADEALYAAKKAGRDRAMVAGETAPEAGPKLVQEDAA